MIRFSLCAAAAVWASACTESGVYAAGPGGTTGPDRAELVGDVCVPVAGGDQFPVKVLFAVEGGKPDVDSQAVAGLVDTLNAVQSRFSDPAHSFGLAAYHSLATGLTPPPTATWYLQSEFVSAADFGAAIPGYASFNASGPISLRAPLKYARAALANDMLTGCRGTVARTRYIVVLLVYSADQSCANPTFNPGIDDDCNAFVGLTPPDFNQCSSCELTRRTQELRELVKRYGAGDVVVQPVYVRTVPDPTVQYQLNAIAQAGGKELVETDPANLKNRVLSLDYFSLANDLEVKRLIAFNRNSISRDGQLLADSDGDGLPDDDETHRYLTDPTVADSDGDRLSDGVEVTMGMNPLAYDTISGCNPDADTDGDRLYDCEERVLGTDGCITDTDGDGLPDFVEVHLGTNPLVAEDLADDDRDGVSNVAEVLAHTDPGSADIGYAQNRAYGYSIDANPDGGAPMLTGDKRACYHFDAYNISLVKTLPHLTPLGQVPAGNNELYLYFIVGHPDDPRGTGIGSLFATTIQFIPPSRKRPSGVVHVTPDEFVVGE